MKYIKIQKAYPDNNVDIYLISLDYPKYNKNRYCYLEELLVFDEIKKKINQIDNDLFKYQIYNMELIPYYIKISNNTFQRIKKYLIKKTKYEKNKENDDFSLLNVLVELCRKDMKNWEL